MLKLVYKTIMCSAVLLLNQIFCKTSEEFFEELKKSKKITQPLFKKYLKSGNDKLLLGIFDLLLNSQNSKKNNFDLFDVLQKEKKIENLLQLFQPKNQKRKIVYFIKTIIAYSVLCSSVGINYILAKKVKTLEETIINQEKQRQKQFFLSQIKQEEESQKVLLKLIYICLAYKRIIKLVKKERKCVLISQKKSTKLFLKKLAELNKQLKVIQNDFLKKIIEPSHIELLLKMAQNKIEKIVKKKSIATIREVDELREGINLLLKEISLVIDESFLDGAEANSSSEKQKREKMTCASGDLKLDENEVQSKDVVREKKTSKKIKRPKKQEATSSGFVRKKDLCQGQNLSTKQQQAHPWRPY